MPERKYRSVAGMKCGVVANVKWSNKFKAAVLKMSPRLTDCVHKETEKWRSFGSLVVYLVKLRNGGLLVHLLCT